MGGGGEFQKTEKGLEEGRTSLLSDRVTRKRDDVGEDEDEGDEG